MDEEALVKVLLRRALSVSAKSGGPSVSQAPSPFHVVHGLRLCQLVRAHTMLGSVPAMQVPPHEFSMPAQMLKMFVFPMYPMYRLCTVLYTALCTVLYTVIYTVLYTVLYTLVKTQSDFKFLV